MFISLFAKCIGLQRTCNCLYDGQKLKNNFTLILTKLICLLAFSFKCFICVEMVEAMKKVAKLDLELTVEERNLLSVAYKNVIGARRASWRIISSIEQKEENKGTDDKLEMIRQYRGQVEKELRDICSDILTVLDKHLIPAASTGESRVFYYKMKVGENCIVPVLLRLCNC